MNRARDAATIEVREARAQAKRARIAERRRWEPCGARIMSDLKRWEIRSKNQSNRWKQHGHVGRPERDCKECEQTAALMSERGTA